MYSSRSHGSSRDNRSSIIAPANPSVVLESRDDRRSGGHRSTTSHRSRHNSGERSSHRSHEHRNGRSRSRSKSSSEIEIRRLNDESIRRECDFYAESNFSKFLTKFVECAGRPMTGLEAEIVEKKEIITEYTYATNAEMATMILPPTSKSSQEVIHCMIRVTKMPPCVFIGTGFGFNVEEARNSAARSFIESCVLVHIVTHNLYKFIATAVRFDPNRVLPDFSKCVRAVQIMELAIQRDSWPNDLLYNPKMETAIIAKLSQLAEKSFFEASGIQAADRRDINEKETGHDVSEKEKRTSRSEREKEAASSKRSTEDRKKCSECGRYDHSSRDCPRRSGRSSQAKDDDRRRKREPDDRKSSRRSPSPLRKKIAEPEKRRYEQRDGRDGRDRYRKDLDMEGERLMKRAAPSEEDAFRRLEKGIVPLKRIEAPPPQYVIPPPAIVDPRDPRELYKSYLDREDVNMRFQREEEMMRRKAEMERAAIEEENRRRMEEQRRAEFEAAERERIERMRYEDARRAEEEDRIRRLEMEMKMRLEAEFAARQKELEDKLRRELEEAKSKLMPDSQLLNLLQQFSSATGVGMAGSGGMPPHQAQLPPPGMQSLHHHPQPVVQHQPQVMTLQPPSVVAPQLPSSYAPYPSRPVENFATPSYAPPMMEQPRGPPPKSDSELQFERIRAEYEEKERALKRLREEITASQQHGYAGEAAQPQPGYGSHVTSGYGATSATTGRAVSPYTDMKRKSNLSEPPKDLVRSGNVTLRSLTESEQRRLRSGDKIYAQDVRTLNWYAGSVHHISGDKAVLNINKQQWRKNLKEIKVVYEG